MTLEGAGLGSAVLLILMFNVVHLSSPLSSESSF